MLNINIDNSTAIMCVVQEILETGQLWIAIDGEDYYIPELVVELNKVILSPIAEA